MHEVRIQYIISIFDFEIPHNQVTVGTGISARGMGPWSFDTIYAEGQRRYVESLSACAAVSERREAGY